MPRMGEDRTSSNRVSVYEAAEHLGITVDAIRKRVSRRTIPHERGEDGRVWVILDTDQDATSKLRDTGQPPSDTTALISAKDETIATLREQLEAERQAHAEARRLLMAALDKIPAIEPPSEAAEEPSEASEAATPQSGREGPEPSLEEPQRALERPWWRRIFGS
jgi:hypothetical protein